MGILSRIFGGSNAGASPRRVVVRAKYDAAAKTPQNAKHWAGADGYSPAAALTDAIRKTLRERCRYEVAKLQWGRGSLAAATCRRSPGPPAGCRFNGAAAL
jgi:hypothetical protein